MWIERRLKTDARFPHPQKFGRLRFWDLDKIETYERACAGTACGDQSRGTGR